jgi:hypothetical protein
VHICIFIMCKCERRRTDSFEEQDTTAQIKYNNQIDNKNIIVVLMCYVTIMFNSVMVINLIIFCKTVLCFKQHVEYTLEVWPLHRRILHIQEIHVKMLLQCVFIIAISSHSFTDPCYVFSLHFTWKFQKLLMIFCSSE